MFYDYTKPLVLPQKLEEKSFDVVIADPPYLSQECLQKTADTVSFLAKAKLILCTGQSYPLFNNSLYSALNYLRYLGNWGEWWWNVNE